VEFVANNPGDWMLHCHLPHHMMNQMSSMVGSMSRRNAMPAGLDMERGMGMLRQGSATSEENGPSLGRGLGVGSTAEQTVSNSPLKAGNPTQHQRMQMGKPDVSKDANSVPGFPQDASMEGPMMALDQMVDEPENFGPRPGWSGFTAAMLTFARTLLFLGFVPARVAGARANPSFRAEDDHTRRAPTDGLTEQPDVRAIGRQHAGSGRQEEAVGTLPKPNSRLPGRTDPRRVVSRR